MKKVNFLLVGIGVLLLLPMVVSAQYVVDYKRQGDQYFAQKDYYAASILYQKALHLLPDTTGKTYFFPYSYAGTFGKKKEKNADKYEYLVYQLGESFRLYKDYGSALQWYDKVLQFNNDKFPLARLWYAVSLRAGGQYKEATGQLKKFMAAYTSQDEYSKRAELELKSCEYALDQMTYPRLADITKLPAPINDSGSNYAAVLQGGNLYFTSSRPLKGVDRQKQNPFVNKIYRSELKGDNEFGDPKIDPSGVDSRTEMAAASFSPAATRIYMTEWHQIKKKGSEVAKYTISVSKKDANKNWSLPQKLPGAANVDGYNTKEPFVTSNGQYLLFSSDRPGGQGGYDLWYCPLDMDGMPSGDAVNLGAAINTPGDDTNPYYDNRNKELVFSSDGRVGLGGFDLFKSTGKLNEGNWSQPENLGYPVNSSRDDNFYFPTSPSGNNSFYTSSDRQSSCCLELYQIDLKHVSIAGTVYDCDTHLPLSGVLVKLADSISSKNIGELKTDSTGKYRFEVANKKPLKLNFTKSKYFAKNVNVSTPDLQLVDTLFSQEICLKAFEIGKPIVIPNILYDFDKATLRPESKVVLDSLVVIMQDNPTFVIRMSSHTDSVGTDAYNMDLSQRRAQSCVDYLISKGISANRMEAKGYGESRPIAPNSLPDGKDNPAGRQKNRRTEFTILKD